MNLRVVHALLILMSAALAAVFGVWCLGRTNGAGAQIAGIVSFAVSLALVAYDSWFLRKTRTLR